MKILSLNLNKIVELLKDWREESVINRESNIYNKTVDFI